MHITLFEVFRTGVATAFERYALIAVIVVAVCGLLYAAFLNRQIMKEPEGTEKMKHLSMAIRTGGNAYLKRQFRTIIVIFFILAVFVFFTGWFSPSQYNPNWVIGLGRAGGFLIGALFSALVGYLGMNVAMRSNVRVAQAARSSFAKGLRSGYGSETVTVMLTDGLGLLGGTILLLIFFRDAPLVLIGFR